MQRKSHQAAFHIPFTSSTCGSARSRDSWGRRRPHTAPAPSPAAQWIVWPPGYHSRSGAAHRALAESKGRGRPHEAGCFWRQRYGFKLRDPLLGLPPRNFLGPFKRSQKDLNAAWRIVRPGGESHFSASVEVSQGRTHRRSASGPVHVPTKHSQWKNSKRLLGASKPASCGHTPTIQTVSHPKRYIKYLVITATSR